MRRTPRQNGGEGWPAPVQIVRRHRQPIPDHVAHGCGTPFGPVLHQPSQGFRVRAHFPELRIRGPVRTRAFGGQPEELTRLGERQQVPIRGQRHPERNAKAPSAFHGPPGGGRIAKGKRRRETFGAFDGMNLQHVIGGNRRQPPKGRRFQPARQSGDRHGQRMDAPLNGFHPETVAVQFGFGAVKIYLQFGQPQPVGRRVRHERGGDAG
ncbi:MAG: hypothetical protein BWX84_00779 [Verrucomicrobia bacterium ADurb.Bin118]|nr:MAG: hypothetical protein BWX84_00779 [Verrucomicrobia bacterium ADurb.Bin118]